MAEGAPRLLVACLCAQWCGACREYRDVFAAMADAAQGEADFAWVDIEDESDALGDPDIENFPTLLIARGDAALFLGPVAPQAQTAERLVRSALAGELAPLGDDARALAARVRSVVDNR